MPLKYRIKRDLLVYAIKRFIFECMANMRLYQVIAEATPESWLAGTIDSEQSTPSLSQAQRLKRFSQDGKLTEDMVLAIMSEQKKPETERVVLQSRQISQYFSPSATPKEMETSILSMLDTAKEWRSYFPEDSTLDDVNRRMRKVLEGMKRTKSRAPER